MTLTSKIGTATLTLILAVGGGSAAFGSGSGARGSTPGVDDNPHVEHPVTPGVDDNPHVEHPVTPGVDDNPHVEHGVETSHHGCSHKDRTMRRLVEHQAMLAASIANIGVRVSALAELKAAAIGNGNTQLAMKIDKRVAKFEREIGRKTARVAKEAARQQQVEDRCAVVTPPAP